MFTICFFTGTPMDPDNPLDKKYVMRMNRKKTCLDGFNQNLNIQNIFGKSFEKNKFRWSQMAF